MAIEHWTNNYMADCAVKIPLYKGIHLSVPFGMINLKIYLKVAYGSFLPGRLVRCQELQPGFLQGVGAKHLCNGSPYDRESVKYPKKLKSIVYFNIVLADWQVRALTLRQVFWLCLGAIHSFIRDNCDRKSLRRPGKLKSIVYFKILLAHGQKDNLPPTIVILPAGGTIPPSSPAENDFAICENSGKVAYGSLLVDNSVSRICRNGGRIVYRVVIREKILNDHFKKVAFKRILRISNGMAFKSIKVKPGKPMKQSPEGRPILLVEAQWI